MTGSLATIDEFGRAHIEGDDALWPRRLIFGLDTVPPPIGSLQVQFARLELVLEGVYRNRLCLPDGRVGEEDVMVGDALFVAGNCWNEPLWDHDVRLLSLLFGPTHLGVSLMEWNAGRKTFASVEKRSCLVPGNGPLNHMVDALSTLREEGVSTAVYGRLQAYAVVEYARRLVAQPIREEERQSSAFFRAACGFIDEHFDRLITRETVASHIGISPNYFSRVFREQGGMTFSDYLTQVRIGKAKFMLEKYDLPLAQIAQRCGFNDFNYFYKVFKKVVGRTPTEYRTSVQSRPAG